MTINIDNVEVSFNGQVSEEIPFIQGRTLIDEKMTDIKMQFIISLY